MTPAPGTIDLGELPPAGAPAHVPPGRVRDRLRRWRGHHHRRTAAVAAAVVLVLGFASAAAPARPALTAHFTVPAAGFLVGERHLYVLERSDDDQEYLTAYRLDDGAVQWRAPLPSQSGLWGGAPEAEALVTVSQRLLQDGDEPVTSTAFDPATGRRLWTRPGLLRAIVAGRILLDTPQSGSTTDSQAPAGSALLAVDPATGQPAWPAPVPVWSHDIEAGDPGTLLTVDPGGRLTTYRLDTGERLATNRLRSPGRPSEPGLEPPGGPSLERTNVRVVGGLGLVLDQPGEYSTTTAYDLETLSRRWTVAERMGDDPGYWDWPSECGSLICVGGPGPPHALDPDTGERVWSVNWLPAGDPQAWYELWQPDLPQLAGHLLLSRYSEVVPDDEPDRWLVDAGTGELVLDLQQWGPAVDAAPAPGAAADAPVPMVSRTGDGTVWIGRLRPDLSGVDPVATIDTPGTCQVQLPYVLCWDAQAAGPELTEADLGVWRLHW